MHHFAQILKIMTRYRYTHTLAIALMAAMSLVGCSSGQETPDTTAQKAENKIPIDTALRSRLKDFAERPRPAGKFAFHVYDITAEKTVYGHNEDMSLPSASCMKLLSGVAGLHLMGCNYQYSTALYTRGTCKADGVWEGDIAFRAGLDPQLMPADLTPFAKTLRQKGVKRVSGRIIVDLTITDPVQSEQHWYPWDLSFSRYGLLYKGAPRVMKHLKAALRAQGIAVADSQMVLGRTTRNFQCHYVHRLPIDEVVKRMWKNSSNTQATSMLYTIGHRANRKVHPVSAGVAYLRHFLQQELGLKDSTLVIHDGCGLCTHNRLSPSALTAILEYGYADSGIRSSLERNLSIAGVDGTLAREMGSSKLRGKIRAKTGTLSHPYGISSLAGLCEGSNGHVLAFAIMDSEMSVLDARVLQRKLCEALVK